MNEHLPPNALAFGDQAQAAIDDKGMAYALTYLGEAGMTLNDLTEEEREILMLGIRAGAMAHLAWSRGER